MLNTVRVPEKFAALFEHAQQYVKRYFADQKWTPEHGTVEICGQRYVLVRAASMSVEFYEMVRGLYGEEAEAQSVAHSLLFDIAHAMGIADAKTFAERMEVSDPIARLSAGPVHFAHAGWAFVDISPDSSPSPNRDFYLLYDHPYSFESDSWLTAKKSTTYPVCIMNAGYSSGWCEHSFGLPLVAVEILCRAKGDSACRFIMAPPDRIAEHVTDYARRNPSLAERIANTRVPGFFARRTDPQLMRLNLELEIQAQQRARQLSVINEQLRLDIAERKRAEAALSLSQELNERLIEALPGGVVYVSKDGALLRANPEALRILGLAYDQISGRYIQDFETETIFEDGTPASAHDYPVTKAIVSGVTQPATTLGVRKPNGETSWAVFRAVPIKDPATQTVDGAVVTFFDITERKRFEDKLRHTQKLESLGVLAGGVAHDFNNLLVTILGNASFAKNLAGADSGIGPLLDEIQTGARRAAELTKQMLDYSGQGKFRVQSLDVPSVVREMTQLLKALIPKSVEMRFQFQEGLPAIEADAAQVRQVIMNLITNAAESIGEMPGRVVIAVEQSYISAQELDAYAGTAAEGGSFLSVEVVDNGSGMDQETRRRIFDPFFTTKFQGRGLGMATVLGIVRGHSGAIRIDSREGSGTRVRVLFPVRPADAQPAAVDTERETILIVDDDEGVQAIARRALVSKGYRVISASNGADAVRLFQQNGQDIRLVIMDMTMPQMNGLEAVKHIRDTAAGRSVPVLLSSGYDVGPAAAETQQFSGVLEKPYGVEDLWDAVDKAIHAAD